MPVASSLNVSFIGFDGTRQEISFPAPFTGESFFKMKRAVCERLGVDDTNIFWQEFCEHCTLKRPITNPETLDGAIKHIMQSTDKDGDAPWLHIVVERIGPNYKSQGHRGANADELKRPPLVHKGVSCDGCFLPNFPGFRYKCTECVDFDLCDACYKADRFDQGHNPEHTRDHPIQRIERSYVDVPSLIIRGAYKTVFPCKFCDEKGFLEAEYTDHVKEKHAKPEEKNMDSDVDPSFKSMLTDLWYDLKLQKAELEGREKAVETAKKKNREREMQLRAIESSASMEKRHALAIAADNISKESTLKEWESVLMSRAERLKGREETVAARAIAVHEKEEELMTRKVELEMEECALNHYESEVKAREAAVQKKENDVEERKKELDEKERELMMREETLSNHEKRSISERTLLALVTREKNLEQKEKVMGARETALAARETDLAEKEKDVEERKKAIDEKERVLRAREDAVAMEKKHALEIYADTMTKEIALKSWESTVEKREQMVKDREAVTVIERALAAKEVCTDKKDRLPSRWNHDPKESKQVSDCHFSYPDLRINGFPEPRPEPRTVRANRPCPLDTAIYYFEVRVNNSDGYLGIGLTKESVSLRRLPGWDAESYGYHGDDGKVYSLQVGSSRGYAYGPTYGTGDVVGCGLNLMEKTVFFTKNGVNLGTTFTITDSHDGFYPTVGLVTPGAVEANFGQRPFVYDIAKDIEAIEMRRLEMESASVACTDSADEDEGVHEKENNEEEKRKDEGRQDDKGNVIVDEDGNEYEKNYEINEEDARLVEFLHSCALRKGTDLPFFETNQKIVLALQHLKSYGMSKKEIWLCTVIFNKRQEKFYLENVARLIKDIELIMESTGLTRNDAIRELMDGKYKVDEKGQLLERMRLNFKKYVLFDGGYLMNDKKDDGEVVIADETRMAEATKDDIVIVNGDVNVNDEDYDSDASYENIDLEYGESMGKE